MKSIALVLFVSALAAGPAFAQHSHMHQGAMMGAPEGARPLAATEGVVQKIDKNAGKITLRHDEIKSMGMPAMTMVFKVKEANFLDKVKAGDKVRFAATNDAGSLVLTAIELAN